MRLLQALDAQAAGGHPLPVVVVDDCSARPLSADVEESAFPHLAVDLIRTDRNRGPGSARNEALERIRTDWVAFLDADMIPGAGWLEQLELRVQRADAPDGIAGGVREERTEATPFTHVTNVPDLASHHGAGNVAFRTAVLREAGGFDERFYEPRSGLHFREDTELRFRLVAAGRRIVDEPDWLAHHPAHESSLWTPVRLARRYHFDPLLAREHPEQFRAFVRRRRLGPISLRQARHYAALAFLTGATTAVVGLAVDNALVLTAGLVVLVLGWAATAVGLAWRRRVRARHLPALAFVAAVVPEIYLWYYLTGIVRFRHVPRL